MKTLKYEEVYRPAWRTCASTLKRKPSFRELLMAAVRRRHESLRQVFDALVLLAAG